MLRILILRTFAAEFKIPLDWGVPGRERVVIEATLFYLGTLSCHNFSLHIDIYCLL